MWSSRAAAQQEGGACTFGRGASGGGQGACCGVGCPAAPTKPRCVVQGGLPRCADRAVLAAMAAMGTPEAHPPIGGHQNPDGGGSHGAQHAWRARKRRPMSGWVGRQRTEAEAPGELLVASTRPPLLSPLMQQLRPVSCPSGMHSAARYCCCTWGPLIAAYHRPAHQGSRKSRRCW